MKKRWLMILYVFLSFGVLLGCANKSTSKAEEEKEGGKTTSQEEKTVNSQKNSEIKVTLLGTGSPTLSMERFGSATLIEIGGEKLLFDVGRGSSLRLEQMNISPAEINKLFLTHLHHDHIVGFPDLLIFGSIPSMGGRKTEVEIWGPKGTKNMVTHTMKAYKADIQNRKTVTKARGSGLDADVHEIKQGVVYDRNGVEVIAFNVDHGSMKPAVGYRINYKGKSVVISGDTTYSENLVKYAKGTDLLIHEVLVAKSDPGEDLKSASIRNIRNYHTTPEQAGKIFKKIKPKLAVYTHLVFLVNEDQANIIQRTKEIFGGEVVIGKDLMTLEVGEKIEIQQP